MKTVKFSDVVTRANTKEDRFNTDKIYYVGGEHIDSNEMKIEKRGVIAGSTIGPMFYCGFKSGDILFVTRNPHLRKCGVVDFDGICSEKTFVLETKNKDILLQEYLAIVMQSDDFWNYCEENKSGGVNYFLNWSTLAEYEFYLPSLAEQKVLAENLWAAYEVKQSYLKMIAATEEMVKAQFVEMFGNPVTNTKGWATMSISEVAPEEPSKDKTKGSVWILNLDMIESNTGKVIDKIFEEDSNLLSVAPFDEGNVLYSKLRPYLNKVVIPDGKGYATTELVPLRPKQDKLNLTFFSHLLRSSNFVSFANGIATGTKMPRMPLNDLRKFKCILPPLNLQREFEAIADQSDKSISELRKSVDAIDKGIKSLINEKL